MTFTIITVCFNAEEYIRKTIESVVGQTYDDYEYIIKDGGSSDSTLNIVHEYADRYRNIRVITGKDNGIYDAMNQAVVQAQGEYVLFLNSKDELYDENVLKKTAEMAETSKADILYGNVTMVNCRTGEKICRMDYAAKKRLNSFSLVVGYTVCHQAVFSKRKLFENKLFDVTIRYWADQEWLFYHMKKHVKIRTMPVMVACYDCEGVSSDSANLDAVRAESDMILERYAPAAGRIVIPLKQAVRHIAGAAKGKGFGRKSE